MLYYFRITPSLGGGDRLMKDETKQEALRRLKSIEGHIRGIERMVEEGAYCVDIIKQGLAVQAAMGKVNALILESHLGTCVTTAIRSDDTAERERVIRELLDVFETSRRL